MTDKENPEEKNSVGFAKKAIAAGVRIVRNTAEARDRAIKGAGDREIQKALKTPEPAENVTTLEVGRIEPFRFIDTPEKGAFTDSVTGDTVTGARLLHDHAAEEAVLSNVVPLRRPPTAQEHVDAILLRRELSPSYRQAYNICHADMARDKGRKAYVLTVEDIDAEVARRFPNPNAVFGDFAGLQACDAHAKFQDEEMANLSETERESLTYPRKPDDLAKDTIETVTAKISGYRQLTYVEQELMNEAKALEIQFLKFIKKVRNHTAQERAKFGGPVEQHRELEAAEPDRWAALARTDVQTATMKICRAIARPKTEE